MRFISENPILKSYNFSQFRNFIQRHSFYNLDGFQDSNHAFFFPDVPSIWINSSIKDDSFELSNADLKKRGLYQQASLLFRSIGIASINFHAVYGSSLGYIYFYTKQFQRSGCKKLLELQKNDASSYKENLVLAAQVRTYYLSEDIYQLFRYNRDHLYLSKINDYNYSLYYFFKFFKDIDIHNKSKQNIEKSNLDKLELSFYRSILDNSDEYPDFVAVDRLKSLPADSHSVFVAKFGLDERLEELAIPVLPLILGYHDIHEQIIIDSMSGKDPTAIGQKRTKESLFSFQKKQANLIGLRTANDYILYFLEKNFDDDLEDYFFTCLAIYEIAFMTMFHPALLFIKEEIEIEQIVITFRFNKLLNFFMKSKSTIKKFCDPKTNLIDGLDKICDELGWVKYSDCLKALYDWYSYNNDCIELEQYFNLLSKSVIRKKMRGRFYFQNWSDVTEDIPITKVYEDGTKFLRDGLNELEFSESRLWYLTIDGILCNILLNEIIFEKTNQLSKYFIKKVTNIIGQKNMQGFLEARNLETFFKSEH